MSPLRNPPLRTVSLQTTRPSTSRVHDKMIPGLLIDRDEAWQRTYRLVRPSIGKMMFRNASTSGVGMS